MRKRTIRKVLIKSYLLACKIIYRAINSFGTVFVPVLAFHRFVDDEVKRNDKTISEDRWFSSKCVFEDQIKWLKDNGFSFVSPDDLYFWIVEGRALPHKPILLTFDDGDLSQLDYVPYILNKYGAKGTVFVIGRHLYNLSLSVPSGAVEDKVSYFTKEQYEKNAYRDNIELQSHTCNLHYKINGTYAINLVSDSVFEEDCKEMQESGFKHIALPFGAYAASTVSIIKKYYKMAFSFDRHVFPYVTRSTNLYYLPRIRVDGTMNVCDLKKYL